MSKYTTEVRFICESAYEEDAFRKEPKNIDNIVNSGIKRCFMEKEVDGESVILVPQFEIYKASHLMPLCGKILRHYYFREIGFETVEQWKVYLINRMREIMPYYNELYKSAELEFNPFEDTNYVRIGAKNDEGKTDKKRGKTESNINMSNNSESGDFNEDNTGSQNRIGVNNENSEDSTNDERLYSETPQSGLSDVREGNYLTDATINNGKRESNNNRVNQEESELTNNRQNQYSSTKDSVNQGERKEDEDENIENLLNSLWNESITGKTGNTSYSKMLMEFRKSILNIDSMIIDELKDLFMLLW